MPYTKTGHGGGEQRTGGADAERGLEEDREASGRQKSMTEYFSVSDHQPPSTDDQKTEKERSSMDMKV